MLLYHVKSWTLSCPTSSQIQHPATPSIPPFMQLAKKAKKTFCFDLASSVTHAEGMHCILPTCISSDSATQKRHHFPNPSSWANVVGHAELANHVLHCIWQTEGEVNRKDPIGRPCIGVDREEILLCNPAFLLWWCAKPSTRVSRVESTEKRPRWLPVALCMLWQDVGLAVLAYFHCTL